MPARPRRSSVNSSASEPILPTQTRTPILLRSHCARHGSECREGHGIQINHKTRRSPRNIKSSPRKKEIITDFVDGVDGNVRRKLDDTFREDKFSNPTDQTNETFVDRNRENGGKITSETGSIYPTTEVLSINVSHNPKKPDENLCRTPPQQPMLMKVSPLQRYLIHFISLP